MRELACNLRVSAIMGKPYKTRQYRKKKKDDVAHPGGHRGGYRGRVGPRGLESHIRSETRKHPQQIDANRGAEDHSREQRNETTRCHPVVVCIK